MGIVVLLSVFVLLQSKVDKMFRMVYDKFSLYKIQNTFNDMINYRLLAANEILSSQR